MRIHLLAICLSVLLGSISSGSGQETDWAKEMFSETSHDFGVVAAGAKVEYKFYIENKWVEDVHITSVRSSCGCTSPKVDKQLLKTWEKAVLTAVINTDTRQFWGRKDATVTVTFDQPFPAEVQVHIHTYIRRDVVVQPGVVKFGSISQGATSQQKVSISYAGKSDWRIDRVENTSPFLESQIAEVSRADGKVKYDLTVTLKADAPAGYIQDQLVLVTNDADQRSARVPVPIEGIITSESLSINPSVLWMGIVEAGQPVTKKLVINGKTPFQIKSVSSSDPRFKCQAPEGAKRAHVLPVTFDAKEGNGKISGKIHIETDYPNAKPLDVNVDVQVNPKGSG
jgi:hypothetical protein